MTPDSNEPLTDQDLADEDDRLDQLEFETRRLNRSIEGLTKALVDTAQVQAKLSGLDERQKAVEEILVPRAELDERVTLVRTEQESYRRKAVRRQTILGVVIVLLISAIAATGIIVGTAFSRDQSSLTADQKQFSDIQYTQCVNSNKGIISLREYLTAQRKSIVLSTDLPAVKEIKLANIDKLLKQYPEPTGKCTHQK